MFLPSTNPFVSVPLLYAAYFVLRGIYRITLHPLAGFPGPKLAGFTRWYEIYWEVYKSGKYALHIEELHKQYGPIIRINPFELHVNDPAFYDQLYNFSPDLDRPKTTQDNLQASATFQVHKARRCAIEPYFSKPAVLKLQYLIRSSVEELCQRLHEARNAGRPADISLLARCLTSDIVTEYLFAQPYGFLSDPVKSEAFFAANNTIFESYYMWRENAIVKFLMQCTALVPSWMLPAGHISKTLQPFRDSVAQRIKVAASRTESDQADAGHRVLFDDWKYLDLPARDKNFEAQLDTAAMFTSAGFETTSFTIEHAMFHLHDNPECLARLQDELATALPDPTEFPDVTVLEKLPYLSAVIQECLRLSLGVMSRLPRKNTKRALRFDDWIIPRGTLVGMSIRLIHYNPKIFPDPHKFDPDRWLKGPDSKELSKYMVAFSRGARRCIGIHLAQAELYITLAALFRRFRFELYQTTRRDVDPVVD